MMANRTDRGSTQVNETMRAVLSSSICLAVDPRKPSGPAAERPNDKAGYTTASAGFRHHRSKALAGMGVVHTRRSAQAGWRRRACDGSFVWEDADDLGAAFDLAIQALERVPSPSRSQHDMPLVLAGHQPCQQHAVLCASVIFALHRASRGPARIIQYISMI
jgi:hypothetical protein